MDSRMESYIERIKNDAEKLIKNVFPVKANNLNGLNHIIERGAQPLLAGYYF